MASKNNRSDPQVDIKEGKTSPLVPTNETTDEKANEFDTLEQTYQKPDVVSWKIFSDRIDERCSKTELQVMKILQKLEALEKKSN